MSVYSAHDHTMCSMLNLWWKANTGHGDVNICICLLSECPRVLVFKSITVHGNNNTLPPLSLALSSLYNNFAENHTSGQLFQVRKPLVTTAYYGVPLVTRSQLDIKEANHLKLSLSLSILLKLYSRSTIWNHIQYYSLPVNSLYHHFPWLDSIRAAEDRRRQSISCDSRKWFINYQTWILQPSCTVQYYKVILYAYKHGIIKKGPKKWSLPKKKLAGSLFTQYYCLSTTLTQIRSLYFVNISLQI